MEIVLINVWSVSQKALLENLMHIGFEMILSIDCMFLFQVVVR